VQLEGMLQCKVLHPDVVRQQVRHVRVQLVEVHQGIVNEPEGVIVAIQDPFVAVWDCRDVGQKGRQSRPVDPARHTYRCG